MNGLKLIVPGEFNDVFLYGRHLYLLSDTHLTVVNFPKLVRQLFVKNKTVNSFLKYAFLRNDFFYDSSNSIRDFLNIDEMKKLFLESLQKFELKEVTEASVQKCIEASIPHEHPGAIHLEVYKDVIFISDESGTYAYRYVNSDLKRESFITEMTSIHIAANYGSTVYFSCGHNGLVLIDFDAMSTRGKRLNTFKSKTYEENAISTESSYSDIVYRTISNEYGYYFNTVWGNDRKELSSEEKVAAYEHLNLRQDNSDILKNKKFVTSYSNRLVTISDGEISFFRMDYGNRYKSDQKNSFYKLESKLKDEKGLLDFNYVYSGFQTVFGLILDTDAGTFSLDDKRRGAGFQKTLLSKGENLKIRHFYRSRNYSHLIASIKNDHLEIYSDLTNYFFPKKKRIIRANMPFGRKNSTETFNWLSGEIDSFLDIDSE